jgi:hypothetical protein
MKRALALVFLFAGCSSQQAPSGLGEPVRVKGAQFIKGDLPGSPPGAAGPVDLKITSVTSTNRVALPGQAGKKIEGRAAARATAVGLRFADLGSGYWVFPLGAADPQFPGELTWEAELDFNLLTSDTPGFHPLRAVAVDANGAAGEQNDTSFCIASRSPDNLSACDPKTAPPDAIVSLYWDAAMDLDLRVALPTGRTVDPKHPLSDPTADAGAADPNVAVVTRDSLASCGDDGRRQEDIVWQKRPKGTIDIYVQLFAPCNKLATSFSVVVYEAEGDVPNRRLVERDRKNGRVVATLNGNESVNPPLYVSSHEFP